MNPSPENPILAAALAYAARGWRVFPCDPHPEKPRSKRPLVVADKGEDGKPIEGTGWPMKASADPEVIRGWWRRWPKALIGMAPGWAGAFVVDLDPKGEPVEAVEARLVEAIGAALPATPRTITQSGGRHLWFRRPEGRGEVGNETPGLVNIDIRCDHGYVILPPSALGNGNGYAWEGGVAYEGEAPDVPAALLALIDGRKRRGGAPSDRSAPQASIQVSARSASEAAREARERYGRGALARIKADAAALQKGGGGPRGGRGKGLYAAACAAGRLVAAGAVSEREAMAALMDAADANGLSRDDGARSVERDIVRGLREGAADAGEVIARIADVEREAEERAHRFAPRGAGPMRHRSDEPPPPDRIPDGPWGRDRSEEVDEIDADADQTGEDGEARGEEAPGRRTLHPSDRGGRWDRGRDHVVFWRRLKRCAALDQSDTDNATRLLTHFGDELRVITQEGGKVPFWAVWDETHWNSATGLYSARAVAQRVGELIKREAWLLRLPPTKMAKIRAAEAAMAVPVDEQTREQRLAIRAAKSEMEDLADIRAARRDFGISSKNSGRIDNMLKEGAGRVLLPSSAFNADPYRFATPSQTVHWERVEDLECPDPDARRYSWRLVARPGHDRRDLITMVVPYDFDPEAPCPIFEAFLARFLPQADVRRFVQVAAGIGLLGVSPQVLIFHYGEGANGKSVFLEVVCRVLGALAASLPAGSIVSDDDDSGVRPTPEIARLFGKRFVRIAEIKEGKKLREDFVKRITGSEAFPARNLFEGFFEFLPQFIPNMSGNGYPSISGTDNGIWRRMRVVKWPVTLADDEQRDFEEVVSEIMTEAPGILRWLVEGASIFLAEGLQTPAGVRAETREMRDEMDTVGAFVASRLEITGDEADFIQAKPLYDVYLAWMAGTKSAVSMTRFGRDMARRKGIVKDTSGSVIVYRCIRLKGGSRNPSGGDPGWSPQEDERF